MRGEQPLDERVAAALGVAPDASERELADAFARAARRRLAKRSETVRTYAAAARAASDIAKQDRTWASPEAAHEVDSYIDERVPYEEDVVAGEELELGTDVGWMLGEAAYNILDDAGLV